MTGTPFRATQTMVAVGAFSWLGENREEWFGALGFGKWLLVEDWTDATRVVQEQKAVLTLIDWGLPHQGARNAVTHFRESQIADRTQLVIVLDHHASLDADETAGARQVGVDVIGARLTAPDFRAQVEEVIALSARRQRQRMALQEMLSRLDQCRPLGERIERALEESAAEFWQAVDERILGLKLVDQYESEDFPLPRETQKQSAEVKAAENQEAGCSENPLAKVQQRAPISRYLDAKASDYEPKSYQRDDGYWEVRSQQGVDWLTGAEYAPATILEMQRAISDALRAGAELPTEMRQDLIYAFEQLMAGIEPELLRAPRFRGKRVDPLETRLKFPAVRYLKWADKVLLVQAKPENEQAKPEKQEKPENVVAAAYRVNKKTAKNWLQELAVSDLPSEATQEEHDEVRRFMIKAGEAYKTMKRRKKLTGN